MSLWWKDFFAVPRRRTDDGPVTAFERPDMRRGRTGEPGAARSIAEGHRRAAARLRTWLRGSLPLIAGAAVLSAGAWTAGYRSAPVRTEAQKGTVEEKGSISAWLNDAVNRIGPFRGGGALSSRQGTQVVKYQEYIGNERSHMIYNGICLYCPTYLVITGDKGTDAIRCPECGCIMAAIEAIQKRNAFLRSGGTMELR